MQTLLEINDILQSKMDVLLYISYLINDHNIVSLQRISDGLCCENVFLALVENSLQHEAVAVLKNGLLGKIHCFDVIEPIH